MSITKQEEAHIAVARNDSDYIHVQSSHRQGFDNRSSVERTSRYASGVSSINIEGIPEQGSSGKKFMTLSNPPRNKWRLIACITLWVCVGFHDATPGALLPYIEDYYDISYSIASLIWVGAALGFIFIACISHKIQPWFGKRKSVTIGCALCIVMYAIVASGTKYPVIVVAFFFGGAGAALEIAQCNIFISRLDKVSTYLSYLHGAYGIGATVSPLIATSLASRGVKWHYFYLVLIGLMLPTMFLINYAFKDADEDMKPWDDDETDLQKISDSSNLGNNTEEIELTDFNKAEEYPQQQQNMMLIALSNPTTWLVAFFVFFYQGAEVSMGGWIVSFFLDYRHGNPKYVGYSASGYWGGLTLGRLLLTRPLHKTLGARRAVTVVSIGSMAVVGLVWGIPNVIAEAVLIAFAGVLIGPNYPLNIAYMAHDGLVPRKIQVISLTIMSAFGSSGGAIFPFIVGLVSQTTGTYIVLPIFIALYGLMVIIWVFIPNVERRNVVPSKNRWKRLWQRVW
ncbi:hypothetical protein G9P44_003941 [Scheffersomyces stipitis]|nr:hypothetical protein G9P44_003941 [Scheffersomyces stipitis]